jgi:DivIVA domain-containing protein
MNPRSKEIPMTDRPERPEFATSMDGYDRCQVDEYIDRLRAIVADAEDRARAAESDRCLPTVTPSAAWRSWARARQ